VENTIAGYKRMSDAIADLSKASGKPPLFFSLCEWGLVSYIPGYYFLLYTDFPFQRKSLPATFCKCMDALLRSAQCTGAALVMGKEIWPELEGMHPETCHNF
jgi:hypothetical protein